jgi:hypothetical protein
MLHRAPSGAASLVNLNQPATMGETVPESQRPSRRRRTGAGKSAQEGSKQPESGSPQERPAQPGETAAAESKPARSGLPGPDLGELHARGLVARAPWRGSTFEPEPAAAPSLAGPAPVPAHLVLPVRAPIDRTDPIDVFSLDVQVKAADGRVLAILRRPLSFPSGSLPGDPAPFAAGFDPRLGICHVLSTAAAARCLLGRGYF